MTAESMPMEIDAKLGQLFVVAADADAADAGSTAQAELLDAVRKHRVGGVIWFASTARETARLNALLQSVSATPLLISADLEAGLGMRFSDVTWWPPAMAVAATGDPRYAEVQGRITAREAAAIGIRQILAPVADVNIDPSNPVINTRSYGEEPEEVARFVAAFIRGVEGEGSIATAKHFPGHGDTRVDSHRALPVLSVSRERLDAVELVPFRAAIAEGVSAIMAGHLSVPALDRTPAPLRDGFENVYGTTAGEVPRDAAVPATVSPAIIDGLLRGELGFDGLVVTDAFNMGGLAAHFEPGEAAVRAIEAGVDQILMPAVLDRAVVAVRDAVRSGRLTSARIDQSIERILRAKERVPSSAIDPAQIDAAEHRAVAAEIAARSIALVRDTRGLLPLMHPSSVVVVSDLPEPNPLEEIVRALAPQRLHTLDAESGDEEADAIRGDAILLLLALRPRSGAGRIGVPAALRRLVARRGERCVAVSFGSPYVLRELPELSTVICAWGVQPVLQRAALRAIRGEVAMTGRNPFVSA